MVRGSTLYREHLSLLLAIAFIPTSIFNSYTFNQPEDDQPACFEVSLDGLLQCLNIFGNATTGSSAPSMQIKRRWAGEGDGQDDDAPVKGGKASTSMRMEWKGHGYPLSMTLYVASSHHQPNP